MGKIREHTLRAPVVAWCRSRGLLPAVEVCFSWGVTDIACARYGPRPGPRQTPPLLEIVAVELKLDDVAGVMRQCRSNQHVADRVFAAMPVERVRRMRGPTLCQFIEHGVGLLAIDGLDVRIVVDASQTGTKWRGCGREFWERKFWRRVGYLYRADERGDPLIGEWAAVRMN